jgi:hypothetical protein
MVELHTFLTSPLVGGEYSGSVHTTKYPSHDGAESVVASPCGICGGQSGSETGFSSSPSGFPSVSFHQRSMLVHV